MRTQLAGTWLIGSVFMGSVALILTTGRGVLPFRPLASLPASTLLALLVLGAAMVLALFALAWRTQEASWLRADPRAPFLWTVAVGGAGLLGWGYAAAATFAAEFGHTTQLVLAFTSGGLPFALCAGMLARRVLVNWVSIGLTVLAFPISLMFMPDPFTTGALLVSMLFGPVAIPL